MKNIDVAKFAEGKLKECQSAVVSLENQVAAFQEQIRSLQSESQVWISLLEMHSGLTARSSAATTGRTTNRKSGGGWPAKILEWLSTLPEGSRFSARDIRRDFSGMLSPSQVSVALSRLVSQGHISVVGFLGEGPRSGKVYVATPKTT